MAKAEQNLSQTTTLSRYNGIDQSFNFLGAREKDRTKLGNVFDEDDFKKFFEKQEKLNADPQQRFSNQAKLIDGFRDTKTHELYYFFVANVAHIPSCDLDLKTAKDLADFLDADPDKSGLPEALAVSAIVGSVMFSELSPVANFEKIRNKIASTSLKIDQNKYEKSHEYGRLVFDVIKQKVKDYNSDFTENLRALIESQPVQGVDFIGANGFSYFNRIWGRFLFLDLALKQTEPVSAQDFLVQAEETLWRERKVWNKIFVDNVKTCLASHKTDVALEVASIHFLLPKQSSMIAEVQMTSNGAVVDLKQEILSTWKQNYLKTKIEMGYDLSELLKSVLSNPGCK